MLLTDGIVSGSSKAARISIALVSLVVVIVAIAGTSLFLVSNNFGSLLGSQEKSNIVGCQVKSYSIFPYENVSYVNVSSASTSNGFTTFSYIANITATTNVSETQGYTTALTTNSTQAGAITAWQIYSCTYLNGNTVPPTQLWFYISCPNCLQGSNVPYVPTTVLSFDGVKYNSSVFSLKAGTSHTISALENYSTICVGYPCNGDNMTLAFVSWSGTVCNPNPKSNVGNCIDFNITNPQANPLTIIVPKVNWEGTLEIIATYKLTAWGNTTY
jgi:hypothetical protein